MKPLGPPCIVASIFGTRPEAIKLAPVLHELSALDKEFRSVNIVTSQHTELLRPFLDLFSIRTDFDLSAMQPGQSLNVLMSRILAALDPILEEVGPDIVLVQGDTTSAIAGAMAAFQRGIPVGHVEAGLRSNNPFSPFPEEMNRRLVGRLAALHFAPTDQNVEMLLKEGIDEKSIYRTGNPVIDAVHWIMKTKKPSARIDELLKSIREPRKLVLTTHRRENFGTTMKGHMRVVREFVEAHEDVSVIFPVHANPAVRAAAEGALSKHSRIHLIDPIDYADFLHLMANAWLIASDSGGVQEEVPTLGKPLIILRENTERPEAVDCGAAKLAGTSAQTLAELLEMAYLGDPWVDSVKTIDNPFGSGDSAKRIVDAIRDGLGLKAPGGVRDSHTADTGTVKHELLG
jgi:UDP-N-acetylglucosamine 2-epimerase (non-hydrolysing)